MFAYLRKSPLPSSKPSVKRSARPLLESLEDRLLLYSTYGGTWVYGSRITYSFMPDGTSVGGTPSALFQTMNAKFPTATWELQFQKAAAVWQNVANINLCQVSDDGSPEACNGNLQDDPRFGDIRIGMMPLSSGVLGETFLPPQYNKSTGNYDSGNGGTEAGDMFLNSTASWQIGTDYDLESVAIHEFGHALGLGESQITTACMYAYYNGVDQPLTIYNGVMQPLTNDDIAGIQSVWGAPQPDQFNSNGQNNNSSKTAANITSYQYFSASNLVQNGYYLEVNKNNFVSGQEVTFHADPNGSVGGLTDGNTYYVVVNGSNPAYIGLASSYANATASTPTLIQLSNISGTKNYLTAIDSNGQIKIPNLRITSPTQFEWFSVTVPATTTGTMVVTEQSTNLSMLSPSLWLYKPGSKLPIAIGSASSTGYGATVSYSLAGVQAGQTYFISASGNAAGDSTGGFGLEVNFGSATQPPIAPPNTVVPQQTLSGGGIFDMSMQLPTGPQVITIGNLSAQGNV